MSHWNYRVIRLTDGYTVRSTYYDDKGVPHSFAAAESIPIEESVDELREELLRIFKAIDLPPLDANKIGASADGRQDDSNAPDS